MDPKFRSSFIPKKPLPVKGGGTKIGQHHSFNIVTFLSGLFFIASLALAGGIFLMDRVVDSRVNQKGIDLNNEKNRLDLGSVENYRALAERLKAAKTLMNRHKVSSKLFLMLNDKTLHNIGYSGFKIEDKLDDQNAEISITGQAASFNALTVQTDVFRRNPILTNITFESIALDEDGNITFEILAEAVGPELLYTIDI